MKNGMLVTVVVGDGGSCVKRWRYTCRSAKHDIAAGLDAVMTTMHWNKARMTVADHFATLRK